MQRRAEPTRERGSHPFAWRRSPSQVSATARSSPRVFSTNRGIGQAARMLHALGDHRRGGQVEGDEVGLAAGQEVTDQAVQVERPGAAEVAR